MYTSVVNLYEWEGTAGKPAVKGDNGQVITLEKSIALRSDKDVEDRRSGRGLTAAG
jgi:hypothetical protein